MRHFHYPRLTMRLSRLAVVFCLGSCALVWAGEKARPARPAAGPLRPLQLAQVQRAAAIGESPDETFLGNDVFLPPDSQAKRRLNRAKQLFEERRFSEAIQLFDALLESSEDYFYQPNAAEPVYKSWKTQALELIGALPKEGRESYELQFGAEARRMLDRAIAAGDLSATAEVSRRFLYTAAGLEATVLLALDHLDRGRPLAAARMLERVYADRHGSAKLEPALSMYRALSWLRAGVPQRSRQALLALKDDHKATRVRIGGEDVPLFRDEKELEHWMATRLPDATRSVAPVAANWVMHRGSPSRNATSAGGRPLLNYRWRVPLSDYPPILERLRRQQQNFIDQGVAIIPSMHPLALGRVVVVRTSHTVLGIDFATGRRIWAANPLKDDPFVQTLTSSQSGTQPAEWMSALEQRVFDDPIYGTLSSDGERVYYTQEPDRTGGPEKEYQTDGRLSNELQAYNSISALELQTEGKLLWSVGGPSVYDPKNFDEPKLAGAFFLGPPLPLGSTLYAIAEIKRQEVRLLALSSKTGALEWSQHLAMVDRGMGGDEPGRRIAGAMPAYAEGVLICPTSSGAVVAVDPSSRSLLWGYQYATDQSALARGQFIFRASVYPPSDALSRGNRWNDSTPTIDGDCVVMSPVESDELLCLDLVGGDLRWKQPRGNGLYVACIHQRQAIVVGRDTVVARKLSDGSSSWPQALSLPAGALPSGRGYYNGRFYFLPLSSGEVVQIDLERGQIISRAKSRQGIIPGNLVCFGGQVLSHGVNYIEAFYQLEPLKQEVAGRLEKRPDDPAALARLGEIKLDEGSLAEAVDLFRRSYKLDPNDFTRDLLVDSVLQGLRTDFAAYEPAGAEIRPLLDTRSQRAAYLKLLAEGQHKVGKFRNALNTYLSLLETPEELKQLERVDEDRSVRRDRWLRNQLARFARSAGPEEQKLLDAAVSRQLAAASQSASPEQLRQFLAVFGWHPRADQGRLQLARRLEDRDTYLERLQLLDELTATSDETLAREATARLALALSQGKQPELAVTHLRRLEDQWGDVPCLGGKTGKQIVAEQRKSPALAALLEPAPIWRMGAVEVSQQAATGLINASAQRSYEVDLRGARNPFFENLSLTLDPIQQALVGKDNLGRDRFRAVLNGQGLRRGSFGAFNSPACNYAAAHGGVLVLCAGGQVIAVDAQASRESPSRILWAHHTIDPNLAGTTSIQPRPLTAAWGPMRYILSDSTGRLLGGAAVLGRQGVCLQRSREVMCVDALSGDVLWTRQNVPAGGELFGDEEYLVIAPSDQRTAVVLRADDGSYVGQRAIESLDERMVTVGRKTIRWESIDGKQVLSLRDVAADTVAWSATFESGLKACMVGDDAVAVMEPDGHFRMLRVADGTAIVDERLEAERSLTAIYVLPSANQYLLIATSPPKGVEPNVNIQSAPGGLNNPLLNGRMYSFDRQSGKKTWARPFEIVQQGLLLSQPRDLPILLFARHVYRSKRNGVQETRAEFMGIDKRTGRVVYREEKSHPLITNFALIGEPERSEIKLFLPSRTLAFRLTDKPIPPEPVAKPQPPGSSAIGEIFKAIQEVAEGLAEGVPAEDDD